MNGVPQPNIAAFRGVPGQAPAPPPGTPGAVGRREGARGGGGFLGIGSCLPSAGLGWLTGASWSRGPPRLCVTAAQHGQRATSQPHGVLVDDPARGEPSGTRSRSTAFADGGCSIVSRRRGPSRIGQEPGQQGGRLTSPDPHGLCSQSTVPGQGTLSRGHGAPADLGGPGRLQAMSSEK